MSIAKVAAFVKGSVGLTRIVEAFGGINKMIAAIGTYVRNKSLLTRSVIVLIGALVVFGLNQIGDLLGIGSCVALIRAM